MHPRALCGADKITPKKVTLKRGIMNKTWGKGLGGARSWARAGRQEEIG